MSIVRDWGHRNSIPFHMLLELETLMGLAGAEALDPSSPDNKEPGSEGRQQALVVLEAAQKDARLFRNNVGALRDERGVPVRYGLANINAAMNKKIKSSDLIGWKSRIVTPTMVGHKVAIFLAREMKHEGWQYDAFDPHQTAQKVFIDLVNAEGGDAAFATGPGTL